VADSYLASYLALDVTRGLKQRARSDPGAGPIKLQLLQHVEAGPDRRAKQRYEGSSQLSRSWAELSFLVLVLNLSRSL
jgi:hypothetical protein